ncbi:hypothetical protein CG736_26565 [Kitasatospora sp. CB02891]|nr:hypothetical protein CG736_26565 [Kitasatospora sp. CB02891]
MGLPARKLRVVQHEISELIVGVVDEVVGPAGHLVGAEPHVEVGAGVGADAQGQHLAHFPTPSGPRFRGPGREDGRHQQGSSE